MVTPSHRSLTVAIKEGPLTAELPATEVPRERWPELVSLRRIYLQIHLASDCRRLLHFVTEAEKLRMWEALGYPDRDAFVREALELHPPDVDWALAGLQRWQPAEAVSYQEAIDLGQQEYGKGKAGPGRGHKTVGPTNRFSGSGTRYFLARLTRDHPALAQRVRAGELSAKRAAIMAGFRHPMLTVRADDACKAVRTLIKRYGLAAVRKACDECRE